MQVTSNIVICNRNPFVALPKRKNHHPRLLYCPRQRYGQVIEVKGEKLVIELMTGETVIEHQKYWSGVIPEQFVLKASA